MIHLSEGTESQLRNGIDLTIGSNGFHFDSMYID
jgi:hypothetical protein